MAQFRSRVAYGLSDALLEVAPFPVQALRAPTPGDIGYLIGTLWIDKVAGEVYILVAVVANQATWRLFETSSGSGVFSTLSSTGNTTLATAGVTVNTFGTTNGATSVTILAGTGGLVLNGSANTDITIGDSLVGGSIIIGGSGLQTGGIAIGTGTGAQILALGGSGDNAVLLGDIQLGGSISLGSSMTTGTINVGGIGAQTGGINIGVGTGGQAITVGGTGANSIVIGGTQTGGAITLGALMTTGTILIGGAGLQTGGIGIGAGTGAQTLILGGTGANDIHVGDAQPGGSISIGGLMTTGTINIGGGGAQTGGIAIGIGTGAQAISIGGSNSHVIVTSGVLGITLTAPFVELPGPVYVYTGAGDPGNGLALHAGDLYIRTDPTLLTNRMFIATGVGAWTNIVCAA